MSLKKRVRSRDIQLAAARAAGIESIDPVPVMGTEITLEGYKALIATGINRLADYNTLLSEASEAKNLVEKTEKEIRDYSERFLAAVAAKFGRNSNEYEMAGGKRKSERRRRAAAANVVVPLRTAA